MNVAIDIGNTRIKIGFYENNILKKHFVLDIATHIEDSPEISDFIKQTQYAIISNVTTIEWIQMLRNYLPERNIFHLQYEMNLPVKIDYENTLGNDRIAAAVGAIKEFSNQPILIIDFGTCIKYNVIDEKTFIGGSISPGISMRYRAMNEYTDKLPLLHHDVNNLEYPLIAKNTNDNIHSGVIYGCLAEIEFYIDKLRQYYPKEWKIIFTGGDALFFENLSKRKVFLRPYLILDGLNEILLHQIT